MRSKGKKHGTGKDKEKGWEKGEKEGCERAMLDKDKAEFAKSVVVFNCVVVLVCACRACDEVNGELKHWDNMTIIELFLYHSQSITVLGVAHSDSHLKQKSRDKTSDEDGSLVAGQKVLWQTCEDC